MIKSKKLHWEGSTVVKIQKKEWRKSIMPKNVGTVASAPGGNSAVSPAVLQKRNDYDAIINGLSSETEWTVLEPEEDEGTREIMVSLSRAAVRVGKEIMNRNDGSFVYVRLANANEAEVKRNTRAKLANQNAKAKSEGKTGSKNKEAVAV